MAYWTQARRRTPSGSLPPEPAIAMPTTVPLTRHCPLLTRFRFPQEAHDLRFGKSVVHVQS